MQTTPATSADPDAAPIVAGPVGAPSAEMSDRAGAARSAATSGEEPIVRSAGARGRAQPMPPDQRRAWIAASAVPLFLEQGAALTTRELAERLGIAEGTIFRAFGDKQSLVRAAVDAFFAQGRTRLAEGLVDPSRPLEEKVAELVRGARARMRDTFTMLSLLDRDEVPAYTSRPRGDEYRNAVAAALAPDADRLRVPLERLGAAIRIAAVSAAVGRFDAESQLTDDELVDVILYGIAGQPRGKE